VGEVVLVLFKSVGEVSFLFGVGVAWPTLPCGFDTLEGVGLQYRLIASHV
jgi:hypothetical protein